MDMLSFLCSVILHKSPTSGHSASTARTGYSSLTTEDMDSLMQRSASFELTTLLEVVDSVPHELYYPLQETQTLKEAIEIFLRGVHHIAVTDANKKLVGILTQSDVIEYLNQDLTRLGLKVGFTLQRTIRANIYTFTFIHRYISISTEILAINYLN